ncbi:MAG: hypothetical protein NW205_07695 [Hyphomicrobiaceae bacterium]|nr:hypothetical protein [Hyphomicrobiaceae bacterium]
MSELLRSQQRYCCDHECALQQAFDPALAVRCFGKASASHPSHHFGIARVALVSRRHRPELRAIGAGVLRRLGRALTHSRSHPFAYWLVRPRSG